MNANEIIITLKGDTDQLKALSDFVPLQLFMCSATKFYRYVHVAVVEEEIVYEVGALRFNVVVRMPENQDMYDLIDRIDFAVNVEHGLKVASVEVSYDPDKMSEGTKTFAHKLRFYSSKSVVDMSNDIKNASGWGYKMEVVYAGNGYVDILFFGYTPTLDLLTLRNLVELYRFTKLSLAYHEG